MPEKTPSQLAQNGIKGRPMTREQLFKKYSINESHSEWNSGIDNWNSVELFRIMHDSRLPDKSDDKVNWITSLLDKQDDLDWWFTNMMSRDDFGSLYLTAKRMIYRHYESIIA